jgi:hypothetical protein
MSNACPLPITRSGIFLTQPGTQASRRFSFRLATHTTTKRSPVHPLDPFAPANQLVTCRGGIRVAATRCGASAIYCARMASTISPKVLKAPSMPGRQAKPQLRRRQLV